MRKLYKDLKKGLKEIIAYKEGKLTLKSEIIQIPEPPKEYRARELEAITLKGSLLRS